MRNQLTPKSDECLFILTDSDLYPQDNWTFVFGVTRPNLRTLVQSIARHDEAFPLVSQFRERIQMVKGIRRAATLDDRRITEAAEGGNYIANMGPYNQTGATDQNGRPIPGLLRSSSLRQTSSAEKLGNI